MSIIIFLVPEFTFLVTRELSIQPNSGNFGWYIKWNGPFRLGPTGIFGTSFEGGPTVTGLVISAVYDICRLQTADRRLQTADC